MLQAALQQQHLSSAQLQSLAAVQQVRPGMPPRKQGKRQVPRPSHTFSDCLLMAPLWSRHHCHLCILQQMRRERALGGSDLPEGPQSSRAELALLKGDCLPHHSSALQEGLRGCTASTEGRHPCSPPVCPQWLRRPQSSVKQGNLPYCPCQSSCQPRVHRGPCPSWSLWWGGSKYTETHIDESKVAKYQTADKLSQRRRVTRRTL